MSSPRTSVPITRLFLEWPWRMGSYSAPSVWWVGSCRYNPQSLQFYLWTCETNNQLRPSQFASSSLKVMFKFCQIWSIIRWTLNALLMRLASASVLALMVRHLDIFMDRNLISSRPNPKPSWFLAHNPNLGYDADGMIYFEDGISPETIAELQRRGHNVHPHPLRGYERSLFGNGYHNFASFGYLSAINVFISFVSLLGKLFSGIL